MSLMREVSRIRINLPLTGAFGRNSLQRFWSKITWVCDSGAVFHHAHRNAGRFIPFLNSNPKKSPELSISQPGDFYGSAKIHAVQVHQARRRLLALLQGCLLFERKIMPNRKWDWRKTKLVPKARFAPR